MQQYDAGVCDLAVIGAGHAGIEAALAAARLGLDTICFTINMDAIGNMPCNPAIGGTGKGHLVRELDALGGEMAKAADQACIQYRMLNRGKGPAVYSLRAQADRRKYQEVMKMTLESQENLRVKQAEVVEILTENGAVSGVVTHTGATYRCRAVVIATGTYLRGRTIVGEVLQDSGPDGLAAAGPLAGCCERLGLRMRRFKTGTPPRVNARTVDFDEMEIQYGDTNPLPFSYSTPTPPENRAVCYLTWTTEETLRIVRENLDRAPMYSGVIEGVGPRYCPSFETKIVRFADKPRHGVERRPDQFVARRPQLFDQRLALTRNVLLQLAALAVEVGESVVHRSVHRPDELRGLPVQLLQHLVRNLGQVLGDDHDTVETAFQRIELRPDLQAQAVPPEPHLEDVLRPAHAVGHLLGLAAQPVVDVGQHFGDRAGGVILFDAGRPEVFQPREGRVVGLVALGGGVVAHVVHNLRLLFRPLVHH